MKQKECPGCAVEIDAGEQSCPVCGYEFPQQAKINYKLAAGVMILILIYPLMRIFC